MPAARFQHFAQFAVATFRECWNLGTAGKYQYQAEFGFDVRFRGFAAKSVASTLNACPPGCHIAVMGVEAT